MLAWARIAPSGAEILTHSRLAVLSNFCALAEIIQICDPVGLERTTALVPVPFQLTIEPLDPTLP